MKKTEIAASVFAALDAIPLAPVGGGPLAVAVDHLAGLSLVPWFCDPSIQWSLRITMPGTKLKKTILKKIAATFPQETGDGSLLVGIPGDGIAPTTWALFPLASAVASIARPGLIVELASANLSVVKFGNHRYRGSIDANGRWIISETTPALTKEALSTAIACGQLVVTNGPWAAKDKSEAFAVMLQWLLSPEANINPQAVKHFMTMKDGAFATADEGMIRRIHGLALGFFRHRLANGPFQWTEPKPAMHSLAELEAVAKAVTDTQ